VCDSTQEIASSPGNPADHDGGALRSRIKESRHLQRASNRITIIASHHDEELAQGAGRVASERNADLDRDCGDMRRGRRAWCVPPRRRSGGTSAARYRRRLSPTSALETAALGVPTASPPAIVPGAQRSPGGRRRRRECRRMRGCRRRARGCADREGTADHRRQMDHFAPTEARATAEQRIKEWSSAPATAQPSLARRFAQK
jgi:hypothetical protein